MINTIDPHGDVILYLSSAGTRLLVSSKILSLASPVFAAMFSPRFREGSSLNPESPTEIELPDDVPSALETICNILHFRHDLVSPDQSFDDLVDIAIVADKYDLASALGPWRDIWLRKYPVVGMGVDGRPERDQRGSREGREIFVRYVFADKEGFEAATRAAILWNDGVDGWGCEALPEKITERITSTRLSAIEGLLGIAEHYRLVYQSPGIKCKVRPPSSYLRGGSSTQSLTCDAAILGSLIRHYSSVGIFPTPQPPYQGLSVGGLAKGLKELRCFVDFDAGHGVCLVVAQVVRGIEEVFGSVKGLDVVECRNGTTTKSHQGDISSGDKGKCGFVWVHRGTVVPATVNTDEARAVPTQAVSGSLFGGGL